MDNVCLFFISMTCSSYLLKNNQLKEHNFETEAKMIILQQELTRERELRLVERKGRTSLQQERRKQKTEMNESVGFSFSAIAVARTPFPDRRGTPRQPSLVRAARGRIQFNKHTIQESHFKDLSSFSHIWVLFVFHENTNSNKTNHSSTAAKIKPPRLHGEKVGCLSTRSPHRPNPIGLSVVEVVSVGEDYIDIACVDMVDGTPILDS